MQSIPLPIFRLGRYDYETAICVFQGARPVVRIQPMIGLDTVLIEAPKVTGVFHLPGGREPMASITGRAGSPGLTRRDLVDGTRKAMRAIYRRAREFPVSVSDPLVNYPPYHLLICTRAELDTNKSWLHFHLESLPSLIQSTPYPPPDF